MSIGMNTNALQYREDLDYSLFDWVRVSLNVFDLGIDLTEWVDNVKKIQKQTKVSACYIHSKETTFETFDNVCDFAEDNKIYTRLAPDCIQEKKDIEAEIDVMNLKLTRYEEERKTSYIMVSDFNVFLGEREDNICMIHMLKPMLFSDGYVYACPSSELAIENNRTLQPEFRVCKMEDILDYYNNMFEVKHFNCSYCKYTNQNNILKDIITEVDDERFC